jgi:two-component system, OmpR family, phosphate regulon sensor histidine kinase PhoR
MAAESPEEDRHPNLPQRLRDRLRSHLPVVLAALLVLLLLAGFGRISMFELLLCAAAILLVAALLPVPGRRRGRRSARPVGVGYEEGSLRRLADALPDPCILLDRRTAIMHFNAAAAGQFGGLAVGDPISRSLRMPVLLSAIEAVRRSGEPAEIELHQTVPHETWHKVTISSLDGGSGVLLVVLQSLTDAKRLEALRSDFIANASHELRTPLTSLLGFIDTLLGPAANDAQAREKFLAIMRTQAVRMSKLIEDLLSLSRIEMRQHLRPTAAVDLALLLREVGEGLHTQVVDAGVAVNLDLPPGPAEVTGDRDELYEVFENLLDNAIKYGAEGGAVDVTLAPATRQGFEFIVTVTDHGAGVEAAHVPRLTERFYRVDAESSRKKRGTGLGLAIVKHIINRHRGALSIRSEPGKGTQVEVLLPR